MAREVLAPDRDAGDRVAVPVRVVVELVLGHGLLVHAERLLLVHVRRAHAACTPHVSGKRRRQRGGMTHLMAMGYMEMYIITTKRTLREVFAVVSNASSSRRGRGSAAEGSERRGRTRTAPPA